MKVSIRSSAFALAAAALLAGCVSDDKIVNPPAAPTTPLLARYVSMGNSITAGMQSAGINDSTQRQAYPVLLARMAGDEAFFTIPSLNKPGCPGPYIGPLGAGGRVGGGGSTSCALRAPFAGLVNNVAVPGATAADLTTPSTASSNALTFFILGGLTQAQAMAAQHPTFVSLGAPNNDYLGPVNAGDTTLAPTVTAYMANYNKAIDAIKAANPQGVALIGLGPRSIPIIEFGAFLFAAYAQAAQAGKPSPFGKPVDTSCAPQQLTGVANPFAYNLVSLQVAADPSVTAIRCTPDAKWVTTTSTAGAAGGSPEYQVFLGRMIAINTQIAAIAQQNGWVYIDPNTLFTDTPDNVRHCQGLDQAATPQAFLTTVAAACPGGSPTAPYFGAMFTFDATHPSLAYHRLLASALATAINAKYGTSIQTNAPSSLLVAR